MWGNWKMRKIQEPLVESLARELVYQESSAAKVGTASNCSAWRSRAWAARCSSAPQPLDTFQPWQEMKQRSCRQEAPSCNGPESVLGERRQEREPRKGWIWALRGQAGVVSMLFLCLIHKWDFTGKDLNSLNNSFISLTYMFQSLKTCTLCFRVVKTRNRR